LSESEFSDGQSYWNTIEGRWVKMTGSLPFFFFVHSNPKNALFDNAYSRLISGGTPILAHRANSPTEREWGRPVDGKLPEGTHAPCIQRSYAMIRGTARNAEWRSNPALPGGEGREDREPAAMRRRFRICVVLSGSHGIIGSRADIDFQLAFVADLKAAVGKAIGEYPFIEFINPSAKAHAGFLSKFFSVIATEATKSLGPKNGRMYIFEEATPPNAEMVA